jgi:hypothetical protein
MHRCWGSTTCSCRSAWRTCSSGDGTRQQGSPGRHAGTKRSGDMRAEHVGSCAVCPPRLDRCLVTGAALQALDTQCWPSGPVLGCPKHSALIAHAAVHRGSLLHLSPTTPLTPPPQPPTPSAPTGSPSPCTASSGGTHPQARSAHPRR